MDGTGTASFLDLDAMRSLSKQRLPIQSKHVEALLEYVEQIQKEARNKALEEAANIAAQYHVRLSAIGGSDPVDATSYAANVALDIRLAILDLKGKESDTGWQLIETASTDGTAILGYNADNVADGIAGERLPVWPQYHIAWWNNKGQWWEDDAVNGIPLTHWMPLPEPPSKGE